MAFVYYGRKFGKRGEPEPGRCCASVHHSDGTRFGTSRQCVRKTKHVEHDRDGVMREWCAQHAPSQEVIRRARIADGIQRERALYTAKSEREFAEQRQKEKALELVARIASLKHGLDPEMIVAECQTIVGLAPAE